MKIAAYLWAGLLAFAPAAAACACPASPTAERMGCKGTSDCCCGDTPSQEGCPRSEPVVDTLEQPLAAPTAAPDVVALPFLDLPAIPGPSPCARADDDGRARASPSLPLYLRCSALLL